MTDSNVPTADPAPPSAAPVHELVLKFHGSAREYFRIWAVNLCLTLLTLGVFSAWAKVRKKRYFYAHTTLDATPFQYLGQPLPILKGRLIAVLLFSLYYLSDHFATALLPYVLAAGLALAPWVLVRSAAFNTRYSAWRNMTFSFDASYRQGLATLYGLGMIPVLVVGTMFDWWGSAAVGAAAYALFGLTFPWWISRLKNFLVNHTVYGGVPGRLATSGNQFFRIYFVSGLFVMGALIVAMILAGVVSNHIKSTHNALIITTVTYAGYVLSYAYIQARGTNLVWNQARLGPVRFQSSLGGGDLAALYFTNAIAIIGSLGLLTPWAVMRTLRYRANHLRVLADGGLANLHGSDTTSVAAAGSELGEFFDMDISL